MTITTTGISIFCPNCESENVSVCSNRACCQDCNVFFYTDEIVEPSPKPVLEQVYRRKLSQPQLEVIKEVYASDYPVLEYFEDLRLLGKNPVSKQAKFKFIKEKFFPNKSIKEL